MAMACTVAPNAFRKRPKLSRKAFSASLRSVISRETPWMPVRIPCSSRIPLITFSTQTVVPFLW